MALHFIIGTSGAGKTRFLFQSVIEESIKHPSMEYLVVVPEQFTLQTQKSIVNAHPAHGIMNIDVLSFLRLAFRVFEELGRNDRYLLEDTEKSMIIKKVLLEKKDDFKVFGGNVKKKGFVGEVKSVISEFYQYAIDDDELDRMLSVASAKPPLYAKLNDIRTVYDGFKAFLRDKYITNEEIYEVLGDSLIHSQLIKNSAVYLDCYAGFMPSQYKLLRMVIRHAREAYVTVTMNNASYYRKVGEHELFHLSHVTIEKLRKMAVDEGKDVVPHFVNTGRVPYRYGNDELAHLERNIYNHGNSEAYGKEPRYVAIYEADDGDGESDAAALMIRKLVREEGYRYKDIAVISADVGKYGTLLGDRFVKMDIPYFVDMKSAITANPLSELVKGLLAVVRYDYSYEAVTNLLRTNLLDFAMDEVDVLENYVIALSINKRYAWNREWKKPYRSSYEVRLSDVNAYRARFMQMMGPLDKVLANKKSTVKDCLTAIYNFLRGQKIEEKLDAFARRMNAHNDTGSKVIAKEYEQVYRLVMEMFDRTAALLRDDVLPLDEFVEIIETGLANIEVGLVPPGTDQIVVGDIERTRLFDIKALFFLGVNDGLVPRAYAGGGILSDADRQFFDAHRVELAPTSRQSAYLDNFYLYVNLTKPKERLFLSYHKLDDEGKSARPASLLKVVRDIFPKIRVIKDGEGLLRERRNINDGENIHPRLKVARNKEAILGTDKGLTYIANSLREYGRQDAPMYFHELLRLYDEDPSLGVETDKLVSAAFYEKGRIGISRESARKLYGDTLLGSVTRMEQYASCAFSHFLAYGLSLEERAEYAISMPDIGNIYHLALEYFSSKMKERGLTFGDLTDDARIGLGSESVQAACVDYNNGILESSSKNAYLVKKVERVLHRTTKTISEQLSLGLLTPHAYEKRFVYANKYLNLAGRIDRMDIYEDEDRVYVQVVDYKSGSTRFDVPSLYHGLQLQLMVYLEAGLRMAREESHGKAVVPASALYYNIDDPIVDKKASIDKSNHVVPENTSLPGPDDAEPYMLQRFKQAESDIRRKLAMNGLVNSDRDVLSVVDTNLKARDGGLNPGYASPAIPVAVGKSGDILKKSSVASNKQFDDLLGFTNKKMQILGNEIMDGNADINPYKYGNRTACDYCAYSSVCAFDTKRRGHGYNKLKKLGDDEAWEKITHETDG